MEILAVRDLTFTYPGQTAPALRNVTVSVEEGAFVVLAGPSGCGKSTLLRQWKPVMTPAGAAEGQVLYRGQPVAALDGRQQACRVGFVQQSPENQVVTDKVWHELAFGLESLGCSTSVIRSRVAEISGFFGITDWYRKNVAELSGGQRQLLNLASVMVMEPDVLILDEPTSQLDPVAASAFLADVIRIHRELGTTVLLTEHRLEEVLPAADRLVILEEGRILADAPPRLAGEQLRKAGHPLFRAMPAPMRIWAGVESALPCPLTVGEGRTWLAAYAAGHPLGPVPPEETRQFSGAPAAELREVWFLYQREGEDVLRGLSLRVYPGELLCVLGGNGTGKTTMLSLLSGLHRPQRGEVLLQASPRAALPQNPQLLFQHATVWEELLEEGEEEARRVAALCHLGGLLERHPYDLSGGEQQRAALAKVLLRRPRLLLLDEPTKGLDAEFKRDFARILRTLTDAGTAVVLVSHDVEFCAAHAHRCALFFQGGIVTEDTPRRFFGANRFYTTTASRMARQLLPEAVTAEDVLAACGVPEQREPPPETPPLPPPPAPGRSGAKRARPPLGRRLLGWLSLAAALCAALWAVTQVELSALLAEDTARAAAEGMLPAAAVFLAGLAGLMLAYREPRREKSAPRGSPVGRAAGLLALLAIPVTIWVGMRFFGDRKYYIVSLLVLLETMIPFAVAFEGRKPRARELTVTAVLCALGVAGRAAFFALPAFKPVLALVILSGAAFGGQTGFLVGAMTMFASNLLFGQGPWTPWQMFAMGLAGLLAGVCFYRGRRSRLALTVFGAAAAVVIYGGLLNPASVLIAQSQPTWAMVVTAWATGFPVDLIHALATALFLWLLSGAMLEKLDRVRRKYGLMM